MNDPLFMGIDGGGSTLRIVIADAALRARCLIAGAAVNPNAVGQAAAQAEIRRGIADALHRARLGPRDITASAIGVAGASNLHSEDWLIETVKPALPESLLVASSDLEIALVGALGQRHGILLLAGTGSAVCGIKTNGGQAQIGGWGYLIGDEGSGCWLGLQLLRHVAAQHDSAVAREDDELTHCCLKALGLKTPRDLIAWLYQTEEPPNSRIARLAELILDLAANDSDAAESSGQWARGVLSTAAAHLAGQAELMRARLNWQNAPVAFAGGLLDHDNPLSQRVARQLSLPARPAAKHPPVMGAALLANMEWSGTQ